MSVTQSLGSVVGENQSVDRVPPVLLGFIVGNHLLRDCDVKCFARHAYSRNFPFATSRPHPIHRPLHLFLWLQPPGHLEQQTGTARIRNGLPTFKTVFCMTAP